MTTANTPTTTRTRRDPDGTLPADAPQVEARALTDERGIKCGAKQRQEV